MTLIKNSWSYCNILLFVYVIVLPLNICHALMPWLVCSTWVIAWWRTCLSRRGLRDTVRTLIGIIPDFLDIAVTKLFFSFPHVVHKYYCIPKLELFNQVKYLICIWACPLFVQALLGLYLTFTSWLAYILFEDTVQGKTVFTSYTVTLYQMSILFTTSNNPDVWLSAYK